MSTAVDGWPLGKLKPVVNDTRLQDTFDLTPEWYAKAGEMSGQDWVDIAFSITPNHTHTEGSDITPYKFKLGIKEPPGLQTRCVHVLRKMCCAVEATRIWNKAQGHALTSSECRDHIVTIVRLIAMANKEPTTLQEPYVPIVLQPQFLELCELIASVQIFLKGVKYPTPSTFAQSMVTVASIVAHWEKAASINVDSIKIKPFCNYLKSNTALEFAAFVQTHMQQISPQWRSQDKVSCLETTIVVHDAAIALRYITHAVDVAALTKLITRSCNTFVSATNHVPGTVVTALQTNNPHIISIPAREVSLSFGKFPVTLQDISTSNGLITFT
jgi:hypothetical protein